MCHRIRSIATVSGLIVLAGATLLAGVFRMDDFAWPGGCTGEPLPTMGAQAALALASLGLLSLVLPRIVFGGQTARPALLAVLLAPFVLALVTGVAPGLTVEAWQLQGARRSSADVDLLLAFEAVRRVSVGAAASGVLLVTWGTAELLGRARRRGAIPVAPMAIALGACLLLAVLVARSTASLVDPWTFFGLGY